MPKTNYVPVQGLDSIAGEKPVGVQHTFNAATGPFVPRSISGGVVTISMWKRGDVTLKHIDDLPVQRENLVNSDHVEVTGDDLQTIYDIYRRAKGDRERLVSEASGYENTTVTPAAQGPTVHVDGDGTVLTPAEVAARRGLLADEAAAWWEEQSYLNLDFGEVTEVELADLVAKVPLNEVELIAALDAEMADGDEPGRPRVLEAVNARLAAHAEAAEAPGWSPLEDGLPIVEVRRRLGTISSADIVRDLLGTERAGKGRKRVAQAVEARLEELEAIEASLASVQPEEVPSGEAGPPLTEGEWDGPATVVGDDEP